MQIREMNAADYDAVYVLWLATPGMGLNTKDDSRDGIEKYLRRNPSTCFVAEENGDIIGVIIAGHDGRRGFIYHTAVIASERCRGIGSELTERALSALKAEGIAKVQLVCFVKNEAGNSFWEGLGFTTREDLILRNRSIMEMTRIDT